MANRTQTERTKRYRERLANQARRVPELEARIAELEAALASTPKAATKLKLDVILRSLQKEYGIPQFQMNALKVIKEHTSPSLEALGEKIRREKEAAAKLASRKR